MKAASPAGRPALPPDLAARLRTCSSADLRGLVAAHLRLMTMREVRQVLLNPYVTGEVIEELLLARHLRSSYELRRALARHRRTPEAAAQQFIPGLFWHDLLEISLDVRLHPTVRRAAEKYLRLRLPRLTVGEKITLARRAPAGVIVELRQDPSPRVIAALLDNPRLTEELLLPLAAGAKQPRILDQVVRNPRWSHRYAVRAALARNPGTPYRALFAILPTLRPDDLTEVAGEESHSTLVRNRAADLLASRPAVPAGD